MSAPASAADWLCAGAIGVAAWLLFAVLLKAAVDHTSGTVRSDAAPAPAPTIPPLPAYRPSRARHAGPAANETQLYTSALHTTLSARDVPWN